MWRNCLDKPKNKKETNRDQNEVWQKLKARAFALVGVAVLFWIIQLIS